MAIHQISLRHKHKEDAPKRHNNNNNNREMFFSPKKMDVEFILIKE
jgi:hypothetical protein